MKKVENFLSLFLMAMLCVASFTACSSDSDPEEATPSATLPKFAEDAAKYEITDDNAAVKSIELTESGQYIVIMNDANNKAKPFVLNASKAQRGIMTRVTDKGEFVGMYYGEYTKTSDGYYMLNDFGTVRINKDDKGAVTSVTIHSNVSGSDWTCPARLYPKSNTDNARSLNICRTWNFEGINYVAKENGKTLGEINASNMKEFWTKMKNLDKKFTAEEGDKWTEEDEADYNAQIASAEADPLQQFIFTMSGSWIIKTKNKTNIIPWRWRSASSNELQAWLVDYDQNGDDMPQENEWKNLFFSGNSDETSGKTIARFDNGKLLLEDTESETDEDGYSRTRIFTLTFSEAK